VIELSTAGGGVENTTSVHLEDHSVSLNGNRNWAHRDGSLELVDGTSYDILVVLDSYDTLGSGGFAASINTLVWVVVLCLLLGLFSIFESELLPSTVATFGLGVAINELLLG